MLINCGVYNLMYFGMGRDLELFDFYMLLLCSSSFVGCFVYFLLPVLHFFFILFFVF